MSYNSYMRDYMLRRAKMRRRKAIDFLGGCCVKCGTTQNLQFDHVDPRTKSFTIARGYSFSKKRFWREVRKCQLLCEYHHKKKSKRETKKGEDRINAAFTNAQVKNLRRKFFKGSISARQIMTKYKCSKPVVYSMLNRRTYKHV